MYYIHGGGFAMGSSYFYLEFLLAWVTLLKQAGFSNPAIFALEYSLIPNQVYPTQLQEAIAGYKHVLRIVGDSSRITVSGDSAGGALSLALLLHLAERADVTQKPGFAALISPWVTLVSDNNRDMPSDFLGVEALHRYARQYAGHERLLQHPLVSPGVCTDVGWWARATPSHGWMIQYGSDEVFAPEIEKLIIRLEQAGADVVIRRQKGGIHAWTVAALFLGSSGPARLQGLQDMANVMWERMGQETVSRGLERLSGKKKKRVILSEKEGNGHTTPTVAGRDGAWWG